MPTTPGCPPALRPCRWGCLRGRRRDLPWRDSRPGRAGLRWAAPAAGARGRAVPSGGRASGRAGSRRRRGGGRFMGRAAGRKEALVSQAAAFLCTARTCRGRSRGATAAGPAPRKRQRLPRRPAPCPDRRRQGPERSHPLSLVQPRGWHSPTPPAPDSGAGCPRLGVASNPARTAALSPPDSGP